LAHVVVSAHARDDEFSVGHGLCNARRCATLVRLRPGLGLLRAAVEHDNLMPGFRQMARHRRAHNTQTNESRSRHAHPRYATSAHAILTQTAETSLWLKNWAGKAWKPRHGLRRERPSYNHQEDQERRSRRPPWRRVEGRLCRLRDRDDGVL